MKIDSCILCDYDTIENGIIKEEGDDNWNYNYFCPRCGHIKFHLTGDIKDTLEKKLILLIFFLMMTIK